MRKRHVGFKWDRGGWQRTTQQSVILPRANVGKDMYFSGDEVASYVPAQCGTIINKTNMKYGALMCIVNGQIYSNEGVWMQETQWIGRLEADMY